MVHLVLRPSDDNPNLFQISMQEDFYHPTDIAALIIPPLIPIIKLLHKVGTITSIVNARIAGLLGMDSIHVPAQGFTYMLFCEPRVLVCEERKHRRHQHHCIPSYRTRLHLRERGYPEV